MVVFSDKAYNAIIRETFEWDPVETGGILLGHILDNGCWIVMEVLPPGYSENREGDNVHHEMGYFEYNQRFVNYLANSVATQYKIPLELLGLWHRHPGSMDYFSSTDDVTNKTFASQNPNGAISGLVNVDPKLRMTMYYIRHTETGMGRPNYQAVDVEVGSDLIPEEYFEMQYYGGEKDDLHPFAPRRSQRHGVTNQYEKNDSDREENGGINIGRILDDQLGYNDHEYHHGERTNLHCNEVPDWFQQIATVFDRLKKKKLRGCLFSILIIVACFFLIKQCWNGVKSICSDSSEYVAKTQDTSTTVEDIRLVASDYIIKDYTPIQIKTMPAIKEEMNWTSSDTSIVQVNNRGQIKAIAKHGEAEISTVYNKLQLVCHVRVDIEDPVSGGTKRPPIEIVNGAFSDACDLQVNQTHKLNIRSNDENFDQSLLSWISNDENIVFVDKRGKVTAKARGKAEIYLYLGNLRVDSIKITVK